MLSGVRLSGKMMGTGKELLEIQVQILVIIVYFNVIYKMNNGKKKIIKHVNEE